MLSSNFGIFQTKSLGELLTKTVLGLETTVIPVKKDEFGYLYAIKWFSSTGLQWASM